MSPYEERQKLLARMRDFLEGKADDPLFDEYELIDVFDFAGDNNDPALQERIMNYAILRYADFQPLLGRQALMLLDNGDRRRAEEVYAKLDPNSTFARIFRAIAMIDDGVDHDQIYEKLDQILIDAEKLNDEEMIRFLETAMDLKGGYDWLIKRMDTLKAHSDFLPTLLFEMAQFGKDEKRYDYAASLIEELTMLEPFDGDYWEFLAETHLQLNDIDKAEQDLEYALAINPLSSRARLLKSHVDIEKGADPVSAFGAISDIIFSEQLDSAPLVFAVSVLVAAGQQDLVKEYLHKYLNAYPYNAGALDLLLKLMPDSQEARDAVERFYQGGGQPDEPYWSSWLFRHYEAGNYEGAVMIGETYVRHAKLADALPYLQALYYTNRPAHVCEYIAKNELLDIDSYSKPEYILLFVMSLIRTNNEAVAQSIIEVSLKTLTDFMKPASIDINIAAYGFGEILKNIRKGMKKGTYPDEYDPLLMPQNIKK